MATAQNMVRFVGIDFGTSTSAVSFKDYYGSTDRINEDEIRPISYDDAVPVKFDGSSTIIPTALFIDPSGSIYFGEEAKLKAKDDSELLRTEFKMNLIETEDSKAVEGAQELTQLFFELVF